jgi:DNA topoisomerase-3
MSEGEGTLEEFLQGQAAFARRLCEKALDADMEAEGELVCPRCHKGVLVKRQGKNGVFWGCSNYPRCRLTTNDKDGKPDLEEAARRARGGSSTRAAVDWKEIDALLGPPHYEA